MYAQSVAMSKEDLHLHLQRVVSYLWVEEMNHYDASDKHERKNHIFQSLLYLDEFLDNLEEELDGS